MKRAFEVTTIAGNSLHGYKDGNALEAKFYHPFAICVSNDGRLYVSDFGGHRIRMVYNNQVTTVAGNGKHGYKDGNALEAMFYNPYGLCISKDGKIYINDYSNNRIRMIEDDQVTTVAGCGQRGYKDGNAHQAMFSGLISICCSNRGTIYVTDTSNHTIRMIYKNKVTTLAGNGKHGFQDGNALEAMFANPWGMCISNDGRIYVTDSNNQRVRMIYNDRVTTIAGNGQEGCQDGDALNSTFSYPYGICISNDGIIYINDNSGHKVRMIYNDQVITIAGNSKKGLKDGIGQDATFSHPYGVCLSKDQDKLYIVEQSHHTIRMISNLEIPISIQKSQFGFSLLLDMRDNILCDSQISFNDINYHLHSTFVNVRCPLLFEKSYYSLIAQSNISNKSFEAFLTFLYSNKLTKEQNDIRPTITFRSMIELIFMFDMLMNCKWIMTDLQTRFTSQLIEMLNSNQQECVRELIVDVLPHLYNLKEIVKTKSDISNINMSYTEYCYNIFVDQLRKRLYTVQPHLQVLYKTKTISSESILQEIRSNSTEIKTLDDKSMVLFAAELAELSKLAFTTTNISIIQNNETKLESLISATHLDKWTKPDFVIRLSNDDIEYHVHKLILCGRWKYFCQMMESGLKEANDNQMTLSDDWNKSRFEKMMKYIYLNEIEFESIEDVEWLIESGKLYGIIVDKEMEKVSHTKVETGNKDETANDKLSSTDTVNNNESVKMKRKEKGAYGFEALYNHCISLVHKNHLD